MARTPAQTAALVKKATASDNKSEGMRDLFDAGMTVAQVKEAFGAPYGYVYGVATRWAAATGNAVPVDPREAKTTGKAATKVAKAAKTTKAARPSAKAPARPAAKAKTTKAPVETRSKAAIASQKRRDAARAAKAKA